MKSSDLLLILGAAILGYAIAPKDVKQAVTPSGLGSFNIAMPEIKLPSFSYPAISYPSISYPSISYPSFDSTDLTDDMRAIIEDGKKEIQDLIEEGKESIKETGIDITSPASGNPLTGLVPGAGNMENWFLEELGQGATVEGWGEIVSGWQVHSTISNRAYDVSGMLGTRKFDILMDMGYQLGQGAMPWQTPPGEGFAAPWKKILFDPDTGKALTFLDIQTILKGG